MPTTNQQLGVSTPTHSDPKQEDDLHQSGPPYAELRKYISQQRHHWLITRDFELTWPLQRRYLAFEANVMEEMHEADREKERRRQQREQEMASASGLAKLSYELYELRMGMCERWRRQRLHGSEKTRCLNAMKKRLSEDYVRMQALSRGTLVKDLISFANDQIVEDTDDGGYARDGMLNYIHEVEV
ncbi:hypothetical protein Daus18300_013845 [Diaporthe australafricana]|uniref:Uncharacterized protein n=1 Tax=Diaporthe australafricana TaxID=127596 RepID=A0ABR3VXR8_9PEZI